MNEILLFLKDLEYLVYIILGALAVWQLRNFILAWDELRSAAFGLEMESAQTRLNRAAALLVVLLFLGTAEFGLVTFIIPAMPDLNPLPTPTIDLLATPTATLALEPTEAGESLQQTPIPGTAVVQAGCIPDEVFISYPQANDVVSGVVEIQGSANIADFGFYKFEISAANAENWLTIQAGDEPTVDDNLGFWDTTQLEPGNYSLRLVVVDNQGLQRDPCAVDITVEMTEE
ncbi:MAG: hypothetical protein ACK2TT_06155 [Anaerolineales bacterium]